MVDNSDSASANTVLYVVVVVVAVLVATVLAPVVWNATQSSDEEQASVAVITLRGGTSSANVNAITEDLREARNNDSIKAVVMRIDSPGGAVTSSEEFYLQMNRTASQMPVVAYVEGAAASGGYYGISTADAIYVKPSSTVGSIGVIVQAPMSALEQADDETETFIRSGPDKATIDKDNYLEELEMLQNSFVGTIMEERGDELSLSRGEVANGKAYRGTEAVQNGFADRMGSLESAIQRAAEESDEIEGNDYNVHYKEPPQTNIGFLLAQDDIEKVDGDVVYVDQSRETEFVQPVKFYAVWGIPKDTLAGEEVSTNESN